MSQVYKCLRVRAELVRLANGDRGHPTSQSHRPEPFAVVLEEQRSFGAWYSSDNNRAFDKYHEEIALIEALKYGMRPGRRSDGLPYGGQCDLLLTAMLTSHQTICAVKPEERPQAEWDDEFEELFDPHDDRPF